MFRKKGNDFDLAVAAAHSATITRGRADEYLKNRFRPVISHREEGARGLLRDIGPPPGQKIEQNRLGHVMGLCDRLDDTLLVDQHGGRNAHHGIVPEYGSIKIETNPTGDGLRIQEGFNDALFLIRYGEEPNRLIREFLREFVEVGNGSDTRPAPSGPELQDQRLTLEGLPAQIIVGRTLQHRLDCEFWSWVADLRRRTEHQAAVIIMLASVPIEILGIVRPPLVRRIP